MDTMKTIAGLKEQGLLGQQKKQQSEPEPCPWCDKVPASWRPATEQYMLACRNPDCPVQPSLKQAPALMVKGQYGYPSPEEAVKAWNSYV